MTLSIPAVYQLARQAGLTHTGAQTATMIAKAESGLNPTARGDVDLTTSKWGPSIGLWQIRSLKSETGTGGTRDASRLPDPAFNARSMVSISGGGMNWGPWSVYTSGAYRDHQSEVITATTGLGSNVAPTVGVSGGTTTPIGDWDPLPGGGGAPGYLDDLLGLDDNVDGLTPSNPIDSLVEAMGRVVIPALFVGLGFTLAAIGVWRVAE